MEDTIVMVPQWVTITDLPHFLSTNEAIARIYSLLGQPFAARAVVQHSRRCSHSLEACPIIDKNFQYPRLVEVEIEGRGNGHKKC